MKEFLYTTGFALGLLAVLLTEAALVWVILAYLVGVNLAFIKVYGIVLLFELARLRLRSK